jgi:hypothetical protein
MRKKIFLILIMLVGLVTIPVQAEGMPNFLADENLVVNEEIGRTTFAAGNSVKVSSNIDGMAFVAGNIVNVNSTQDYLFAAGNNVTLDGTTTKDAFVAGNFLTVNSSTIRDLYMAGTTMTVNSDLTGNLYAIGTNVSINSKIDGDVYLAADTITIGKDAVINGTLKYPDDTKLEVKESAVINNAEAYEGTTTKVDVEKVDLDLDINPMAIIIGKLLGTLFKFTAMLIIAFLLLALNKKAFESIKNEKQDFGYIALTSLLGFAFLILLPIAAIIVMCTVIGLPLGIIALTIYSLLIYLSIIPTAYYFGNLMFGKKIKNRFLLMFISLILLYIVRLIPFLGGLISFISLIFGLGMYTVLMKNSIADKK